MEIIDYNGEGRWTRSAILERYARYAAEAGIPPRDLTPAEHTERGRHWVYPAMEKVTAGIEADDPASVRIGIEFIGDDGKFVFGRTLKANTARALSRASLTPARGVTRSRFPLRHLPPRDRRRESVHTFLGTNADANDV